MSDVVHDPSAASLYSGRVFPDVGLTSFPGTKGTLLGKASCLCLGLLLLRTSCACECLGAHQVSLSGHWAPALPTHLGKEKAAASTLWTFSCLSACSIITVHTNCMALQNQDLMWPTLQRKTELLEYPAAQRTSSIVSGQEGFQEQTVCAGNKNSFRIDAELFFERDGCVYFLSKNFCLTFLKIAASFYFVFP